MCEQQVVLYVDFQFAIFVIDKEQHD
ncbi:hypothetical protein PPL_08479 [Heterostelium album PN500]|uniref:Uncharacterized protein n=1 Tax=Heterostelium pallidum (strain ATCC 26659 / Pp 5 / PN500) TaxID=670386 RepID=D3BIB1_HETP5|nr:hypothetical protein PPL_08479 [Heterostelium album PN500]